MPTIQQVLAAVLAVLPLFAVPSALAHGDYHSVVAKLGEELAADPDNTSIRVLLATAHVEHGEWDLCLDEAATIHRLAPGVSDAGSIEVQTR